MGIIKFLKDELGSILIFIFYSISIITYFIVSKDEFSVVYTILLALFFLIIMLVINLIIYYTRINLIKKLSLGECDCKAKLSTDEQIVLTMNKLHHDYNEKINRLGIEKTNDKRFISAWIHNLKTPISVNKMLIERAKNKEIDAYQALNDIENENERISHIIDAILDIERLDEFSIDYYPEEINLELELREIINDNKRLFITSNVFPKLDCNSDITILSDRKWNKVLINQIISNAVKYSNNSQEIVLSAFRESDKVVLCIKDFGYGIAEYDLKKIYEPFFTGENGRRVKSSSGIGLYLCKEICDHLNHKIEIESKINEGTVVKITYLTKM